MEETKKCNKCEDVLPINHFEKQWKQKSKGKLRNICKSCREGRIIKTDIRYIDSFVNVETIEDLHNFMNKATRHRINRYNISTDQFKLLLKSQNEACAICKTKFNNSCDIHIDHCHESTNVRGLLCRTCNFGIGYLKDSIYNLEEAINYLKNNTYSKIKEEYYNTKYLPTLYIPKPPKNYRKTQDTPVFVFNLKKQFLTSFSSIPEAVIHLNINRFDIHYALNSKKHVLKGKYIVNDKLDLPDYHK